MSNVIRVAIGLAAIFGSTFCWAQASSLILEGRTLPINEADFCYDINRDWRAKNPLPHDRPYLSEYVEQHDGVQSRLKELLLSAHDSRPASLRNAYRLYQSFVNTKKRNRDGIGPLKKELESINAINSSIDLALWIARANQSHRDLVGVANTVPAPFSIEVWPDDSNAKHTVLKVLQSGLSFPNRSYYLDSSPKFGSLREKFREHVAHVFTLAGDRNGKTSAAAVLEVETVLAGYQWDEARRQNTQERSKKLTTIQLAAFAPDFNWNALLVGLGSTAQEVTLQEPSYVQFASRYLAKLAPPQRAAYLRWQLLRRYTYVLSEPFEASAFEFFGKKILGFKTKPTTERLGLELAQTNLPEEISLAYVKAYFSPEAKAQAQAIAETVRAAYRNRITDASWLSMSTRSAALRKLDTLRIDIGYPSTPEPLRKIQLSSNDVIGNLIKLSKRAHAMALDRLVNAADQNGWFYAPASVNGGYSVTRNSMVITAGRLLGPIFDIEADDASNFGGLGTLIGHEAGHALDNQGRSYDADGNLHDWWTAEDEHEFKRRSMALIEQYNRFEPLPSIHIDGTASISEAIADLTGLSVGYDALKLARQSQGKNLTREDEQRFFAAWARRWRVQYTEPLLTRILKGDTHPPLQYRCSVSLANFTPFYEAIRITPGAPLFIPAEQRVTIW